MTGRQPARNQIARSVGSVSPVPGGVGPRPSLLGAFVPAALLQAAFLRSRGALGLREVVQTGGRAAAEPQPAVEAPTEPQHRETASESELTHD